MEKSIQLFIFDWSGTISDDRHPVYVANQLMSDHWGVPRISFEEWLPKTALSAVAYFQDAGVKATADEINALYERIYNEVTSDATQYPKMYADAPASLLAIRRLGKPMALVSAHPEYNLASEADRYGLRELFDNVVGSVRDTSVPIRELMDDYGVPASQTLYIGDTTSDIRHAKSAGVQMYALTTGYHTRAALASAGPDEIFNSLTELAHHLTTKA